jgi:hypothetical protein
MDDIQKIHKLKLEKEYLKIFFKENPNTFVYMQIVKLISRIRYLENCLKYDYFEE